MCKVRIPAHVTLLLRQHNWDEVAVYSCTETSIHFGSHCLVTIFTAKPSLWFISL